MKSRFVLILISFTLTWQQSSAQKFTEVQSQRGVDHFFSHTNFLGGGAAFFDYDNDGDEDLYLVGGRNMDHLYENDGTGHFTNIADKVGLGLTANYYTTAVVTCDINNDGYRDIFITTAGSTQGGLGKSLLFFNFGDGSFYDIWILSGTDDNVFSMGAICLDYDNDGYLDIYTLNYVETPRFIYDDNNVIIGFDHKCYKNRFYRNKGNLEFEEISADLHLDDPGCSLAATATDFDGDGDQDIYLANDFGPFVEPNKLFQFDQSTFTFNEVGEQTGADLAIYGMGIAVGDYDMDADLDYYVTNLGRNVLLDNSEGIFTDATTPAGIENTWNVPDTFYAVGWGTVFFDADNDMDLDLYISNGYVPSPAFIETGFKDKDVFYVNNGDRTFSNRTMGASIDNDQVSRGTASADIDNDGDMDIISVVMNAPVNDGPWPTRLFLNETDSTGHWLKIKLIGHTINRDALGSKVKAFVGDKVLLREVSGGSSHCSQNSSVVHIGLGGHTFVDSLIIHWHGKTHPQKIYNIGADNFLTIEEDTTSIMTMTTDIYAREIRVFPNPGTNKIFIQSDQAIQQISIFNLTGQSIGRYPNPGTQMDISRLQPGIYLMKIDMPRYAVMEKFVKL